ncbi:hypothetical protein C0989_010977, partial [Termitomyces sp. Mn162]
GLPPPTNCTLRTNLTPPPPPSSKKTPATPPPVSAQRLDRWKTPPLLPATPTKDQSPDRPEHMSETQRSTPLYQHNTRLRRRLGKTPTPWVQDPRSQTQQRHQKAPQNSAGRLPTPLPSLGTLPMALRPAPTTPGLADTDGTSGPNPRLWIH